MLVLATNNKREKVLFRPVSPHHVPYFLLKSTVHKEGPENRFSPILANAIWDQHFRFSRPQRDGRIGGNFETRMIRIPRKRVCQFSIVRHLSRTEIGSALQHCGLWEVNHSFRCHVVNIGSIYKQ